MAIQAAVTGWGTYSPARIMTNAELEALVDTSDAWIRSRTGIRQRHIAGPADTTSSMGQAAAAAALAHAELGPGDIDLIICASTTPDFLLPASACLIQQRLGATRAAAFDLNAACSGFLYALTVGSQFIQAGTYRRVLVVCAEALSRFMDWRDRNTCIIFGDGAAALVLEATAQDAGLVSTVLGSRGDADGLLAIPAGGAARPASAATIAGGEHFLRMRGNEVFKLAVHSMTVASREAVFKAGLRLDDLTAVVPHQANLRIIRSMQDALGLADDKIGITVDHHGNTGAASVPLALAELLAIKPPPVGANLLLVAFGGGLTWGAAVLRWADIAAIKRERGQQVGSVSMPGVQGKPILPSAA